MNSQFTVNHTAHIIHSHYAQITIESKHRAFSVKIATGSVYINTFYTTPNNERK